MLCLLLLSFNGLAQDNRYMVFFKDKNGSPYSVSSPQAYLSPAAITRRIQQGISVTQDDIPVNTSYLQGVAALGVDVYFPTRWMNGVLVQCPPEQVASLQGLSYVSRVELVAPGKKLMSKGRKKTISKTKSSQALGVTQTQLSMLGIDNMQAAGYHGEDVVIAVFDSGFEGVDVTTPFQPIFQTNRINLDVSKDFVYNSGDVFQYDDHGAEVFSVIAAYQDGSFTGAAYQAQYQLYVTEDVNSEYRIEEYNWLFAAERADSAGADVISSSLGYYDFDDASMNYTKAQMDGKTAVITLAAEAAAARGMVVVCSAGNEGNIPSWQIITAPADAPHVLAVASVNASRIRASSSSIGPAADGRIKPDVAAMGQGTSVIKPNGTIGTASGTSLAAPLITGLVAGVWQRYPNLTAEQVMSAIRLSASQATAPDNLLGYGIPNFVAVANYLDARPQDELFAIYPNPANGTASVTISPRSVEEVTAMEVEIVSGLGEIIRKEAVSFSWLNRTYTLNLVDQAAGSYFIRILAGGKTYVYKLIKI